MEKKTIRSFEDVGFGFKVKIINAPMVKIRGEWVLDLDQNKLQKSLLKALARKPTRLTGNEIHFIRLYFEMSSTTFGGKFDVSHPAVLKWERSGNRGTGMNWATEKDIRLFILSKLQPKPMDFLSTYQGLEDRANDAGQAPVEIDAKKVA